MLGASAERELARQACNYTSLFDDGAGLILPAQLPIMPASMQRRMASDYLGCMGGQKRLNECCQVAGFKAEECLPLCEFTQKRIDADEFEALAVKCFEEMESNALEWFQCIAEKAY